MKPGTKSYELEKCASADVGRSRRAVGEGFPEEGQPGLHPGRPGRRRGRISAKRGARGEPEQQRRMQRCIQPSADTACQSWGGRGDRESREEQREKGGLDPGRIYAILKNVTVTVGKQ